MINTAKSQKSNASDIPKDGWVKHYLPTVLWPYATIARFDRPIGTWLLLFPGWWSLALATKDWTSSVGVQAFTLWYFVLFGIGAVVMRGAGCVLNDITDREFDAKVARTSDRPIPSGAISVYQATIYMILLSLIGFITLIQFNRFTVIIGSASLLLVVIYPFMKRITYWPQFVLGLTFNWGALLGWAAVKGDIQIPAIVLYIAGIFWTLGYDTIYAHQDKEDDSTIGIKSSALKLGGSTRPWLFIFYGAAVVFIGISGWHMQLSWTFYVLLCFATVQLGWQAADLDLNNADDCLRKFKSNRLFGWLILAGIVVGHIF